MGQSDTQHEKQVTVVNIGEARKLARKIRNYAADLDRELATIQGQLVGIDADRLHEHGISLDLGGLAS